MNSNDKNNLFGFHFPACISLNRIGFSEVIHSFTNSIYMSWHLPCSTCHNGKFSLSCRVPRTTNLLSDSRSRSAIAIAFGRCVTIDRASVSWNIHYKFQQKVMRANRDLSKAANKVKHPTRIWVFNLEFYITGSFLNLSREHLKFGVISTSYLIWTIRCVAFVYLLYTSYISRECVKPLLVFEQWKITLPSLGIWQVRGRFIEYGMSKV